jgi:serine O-acetyltransferase
MFDELLHDNCFAADESARRAAGEKLEHLYNCQIAAVEMDRSVVFAHHGRGCTIMAAKICEGTVIFQNVTIGVNPRFNKRIGEWENVGNPIIGPRVTIADGAKIFGPVTVGADSFVAAGALVTRDVPPGSLVSGVNQIEPKDPEIDYVYHDPMIDPEVLMAVNRRRIAEFRDAHECAAHGPAD